MGPLNLRATRMLWEAAGRPELDVITHDAPDDYPCWWCGKSCEGASVVVRHVLSDTFPLAHLAAKPEVTGRDQLCGACAWSFSDHIALPEDYARAKLIERAREGARVQVGVGSRDPVRRLALLLADGQVGLWKPGAAVRHEEVWHAQKEGLRVSPRNVGALHLDVIVNAADLHPGPTEKFRSYHHAVIEGRWVVFTDSDKAKMRELVCAPPHSAWCLVIGDGQKHRACLALGNPAMSPGADGRGIQVVHFDGRDVFYAAHVLLNLIAAVEQLLRAGVAENDIRTGNYRPSTGTAAWAIRTYEPVISPERARGGTLDLALYLRRPKDKAP